MKDTYNLLADGILALIRELARLSGRRPQAWGGEQGLSRYFAKSINGQAEIDWSSRAAREEFLGGLVADAEKLEGDESQFEWFAAQLGFSRLLSGRAAEAVGTFEEFASGFRTTEPLEYWSFALWAAGQLDAALGKALESAVWTPAGLQLGERGRWASPPSAPPSSAAPRRRRPSSRARPKCSVGVASTGWPRS